MWLIRYRNGKPLRILVQQDMLEMAVAQTRTRANLQSDHHCQNANTEFLWRLDALPVTNRQCQNIQGLSKYSFRFNGHFPAGSWLASTRISPFWILLELRVMEVVITGALRRAKLQSKRHYIVYTNHLPAFLQAGCPSCHPTNSIEARSFTTR